MDKTFDGLVATQYTSYEEYIARLRAEQAVKQARYGNDPGPIVDESGNQIVPENYVPY